MVVVPWLAVAGFGAHIRSTSGGLVIQRNGSVQEYPYGAIGHLLLVGGHTIQTSVINRLVNAGTAISFFEADGSPVGFIRPPGDRTTEEMRTIQERVPGHGYAVAIAGSSINSRLLLIESLREKAGREILYEGEIAIVRKALEELPYLVKMDEVRRLHRLASDMYYEIISRLVPPEFGFRRRTSRPHQDPVNAMLTFGYGMLYGNCGFAVTGAGLDHDIGTLHRGPGSLVYDLIEPLKAKMIDAQVIAVAGADLVAEDFESAGPRCILSDSLMKRLIAIFHNSIDQKVIDEQVIRFCDSITSGTEFRVLY
ncbi:MAG: CRISPR-associated endonuclease Cas1 [Methanoregulaceae archaeon]|nr:CRISPR-associated endonuclease Cas1 [Methanoregulaceae archaeon]